MSVLQWKLTCEISQYNDRFKPQKLHHCSNITLLIFGKDQFFSMTLTDKTILLKNHWHSYKCWSYTAKRLEVNENTGHVVLFSTVTESWSQVNVRGFGNYIVKGIFLKIHGYPESFRTALIDWVICILHLRWLLFILTSTSSAHVRLC